MCIYIYIYVCMYVCMYLYIYIYIYTHTHMAARGPRGLRHRNKYDEMVSHLMIALLSSVVLAFLFLR